MPAGGYGGQWKMIELVTRYFWWPGVTREVDVEGTFEVNYLRSMR